MFIRPDPTDLFTIEPDGKDLVATIDATMPLYAQGAVLLAVLAQPPASATPKDLRPLRKTIMSRCRLFFEDVADGSGGRFPVPALSDLRHVKYSLMLAEQTEKKTRKALNDCMGAAKAVYPLLAHTEDPVASEFRNRLAGMTLGDGINLTIQSEDSRREGLAKLGKAVQPRFGTGNDAPVNFESRAFKASRPVLHLAVALAEVMNSTEELLLRNPHMTDPSSPISHMLKQDASGPGGSIRFQLDAMWFQADLDLQEAVVQRAMQIEPYIRRLPRLRLDRIVKLRLGPGEPGTAPDA